MISTSGAWGKHRVLKAWYDFEYMTEAMLKAPQCRELLYREDQ